MEIKGKIIQVLPFQKGVSKTSGKEWQLQAYVLETLENYPKKVHFELFGEDRIKMNPCALDDIVNVQFDLESREFNARWYTSVRAWRIEKPNEEGVKEDVAENVAENVDILADMPNAEEFDNQQTDGLPF